MAANDAAMAPDKDHVLQWADNMPVAALLACNPKTAGEKTGGITATMTPGWTLPARALKLCPATAWCERKSLAELALAKGDGHWDAH